MSNDAASATARESYRERIRSFSITEEEFELGQKNESDTDYNREKVLQRDLGEMSVIGSLSRIQYGSWDGAPACLMTLRLQFQSGNAQTLRFEKARIVVEFLSRPRGEPKDDPVIKNYGPKALLAKESLEERKWYYDLKLSAKAVAGPFEMGPEISTGKEGTFSRAYAASVTADDWGDRRHRKHNCLRVWMNENRRQKEGIPTELLLTVIVTHAGPMQATVRVKVDHVFHLLAWPWSDDDPILLEPGENHGDQLRGGATIDFASLGDQEWMQLVTPDLRPVDKTTAR